MCSANILSGDIHCMLHLHKNIWTLCQDCVFCMGLPEFVDPIGSHSLLKAVCLSTPRSVLLLRLYTINTYNRMFLHILFILYFASFVSQSREKKKIILKATYFVILLT